MSKSELKMRRNHLAADEHGSTPIEPNASAFIRVYLRLRIVFQQTPKPLRRAITAAALLCSTLPAAVPIDLSGVRPGPISVRSSADSIIVAWPDETGKSWTAEFSLDPRKPLITGIAVNGAKVIDRARPFYSCSTGKRRGGWDAFFDFPPSHPEGTRSFLGKFELQSARVTSIGNRVEIRYRRILPKSARVDRALSE